MEPVIQIRNVSKLYRLGETQAYGTLREALVRACRKPWEAIHHSRNGSHNAERQHFWALRDVSFDVEPGDSVGILGANGAGKTTLLKILSRITDPTEGSAHVRGRMASLLEVGTGFHPELTGRENIYLNGAILGMKKAEIEDRFDEIISFAGIGMFLDTPVKRYSSGMYVRLAFSIAAHLDPEILIVDEVLAVGDAAFQKKCLGKMAETYKRSKTVLFVSHNLAAVENLCNRGVVLHKGNLIFVGTARQAIEFYLREIAGEQTACTSHMVDLSHAPGRPPRVRPQLTKLELFSNGIPLTGPLPVGAPLTAVIHFNLEVPCTTFDAQIAFDTPAGQRVCTAHSAYEPVRLLGERSGPQVFVCDIRSITLLPGDYKVHVGLDMMNSDLDWVEDATRLQVTNSDFYGTGIIPTKGMFLLDNRWHLLAAHEFHGAAK